MIHAIADQSDITVWPMWVLVLVAIPIAAATLVILALVATPHNVPVMGDELSRLDRLDGIGDTCRRRGHNYRLNDAQTTYVCTNNGCNDIRHRFGGVA